MDLLKRYIVATTNLYGVISFGKLAGYSLSMSGYEEEVMALISDYAPHIRKWEYNGFTEAEMKKQKND